MTRRPWNKADTEEDDPLDVYNEDGELVVQPDDQLVEGAAATHDQSDDGTAFKSFLCYFQTPADRLSRARRSGKQIHPACVPSRMEAKWNVREDPTVLPYQSVGFQLWR